MTGAVGGRHCESASLAAVGADIPHRNSPASDEYPVTIPQP
jgi:hypothetical protein